REKHGSVGIGVQVAIILQVPAKRAHISRIQHHAPRQFRLDRELVGVGSWDLSLRIGRKHSWRTQQDVLWVYILGKSVGEGGLHRLRRVPNEVEHPIALEAVVEHAAAGTNNDSLSARDIPGHAKAWTPLNPAILLEVLV